MNEALKESTIFIKGGLAVDALGEPGPGGAPGAYRIYEIEGVVTLDIVFQRGGVAEVGHNGVTIEALLAIVADQLSAFQAGPFPSPLNRRALHGVQFAMAALADRTAERVERGVEGRAVA